jgi:hypothetical protein
MIASDLRHGDRLIATDGTGPILEIVLRSTDGGCEQATSLFDTKEWGSILLTDEAIAHEYRWYPIGSST